MENGAYSSTQNDSLFNSGEAFGESVFVAVTDKEKVDKEDISTQEKVEKARLNPHYSLSE
jgi:hypothetical protein